MVGIGGGDIRNGNKKYILAIVWQVMRDHTLQIIGGKTEKDLVDWANSRVDPEHKVKDLKDKSISDSMFLLDICKSIEPRSIDWDIVKKNATDDKDKESNAKYVISVARKLDALVFLVWEDIVEVKKIVLTFIASLYDVAQKYNK